MKPCVIEKSYPIDEQYQNVSCCDILNKIHRKLLTLSPAKIVASGKIIYNKRTSRMQRPKTLKNVKSGTKKSVVYGGLFSKEHGHLPTDYFQSLVGISYIEIICDETERRITIRISCLSGILGWIIFASIFTIVTFPIFYFNSHILVWVAVACGSFVILFFVNFIGIFFAITKIKSLIRHIEEIRRF